MQTTFTYIFLDEPLPECFGMPKGMTFSDLFVSFGGHANRVIQKAAEREVKTPEEARKDILDGILRDIGDAQYELFESFFQELQEVTDYTQLTSRKFIGNSENAASNHTEGNNLVEWMFSGSGRVDACFIQKEGLKYVFIWGVRMSNHGKTKDTYLHEQRRKTAKIIIDAFKGRGDVDPDGVFKKGLLAHHREQLESNKTLEGQYQCLLATIDELIVVQDSVLEKVATFERELNKCYGNVDEIKLKKYIQEQLLANNIKEYQKELFEKLFNFDYKNEKEHDSLEASFLKINIARKEATTFINEAVDLINGDQEISDIEKKKIILNCFSSFHKIPVSYLYVFKDIIDDIPEDADNGALKKKMNSLVSSMVQLRKSCIENMQPVSFERVEDLFSRIKINGIQDNFGFVSLQTMETHHVDKIYRDFLNISVDKLTRPKHIELIAKAFVKMIVEEGAFIPLYEIKNDTKQSKNAHTLSGLVLNPTDTLMDVFKQIIHREGVQDALSKQYPFLGKYLQIVQRGVELPNLEDLNTVCEYMDSYLQHGWAEFYKEAELKLNSISEIQMDVLKFYLANVYLTHSNHKELSEFIYTELVIKNQQKAILEKEKRLLAQEKLKQQRPVVSLDSMADVIATFEGVYAEFLYDMENPALQKKLETVCAALNGNQLSDLSKKGDDQSLFIKDYMKFKSQKKSKKNPVTFEDVVKKLIERHTQNRQKSFQNALNAFILNPQDASVVLSLKRAVDVLTEKDLNHFVELWRKYREQYPFQLDFVTTLKKDTFEEAKNVVLNAINAANQSRINSVQIQFKTVLAFFDQEAEGQLSEKVTKDKFLDEKDKAVTLLINKAMALRDDDFEVISARTDNSENAIMHAFFQEVQTYKNRNSKNLREQIVDAIDSAKYRDRFQKAMNDLLADTYNDQKKMQFVDAVLNLRRNDFDYFVQNKRNDAIFATSFEKLKQQHVRYKSKVKPSDVIQIVDSTIRKYHFSNAFYSYVSNSQANDIIAEVCIDTYLQLTDDEQKETLNERNSNVVFSAFFSQLNEMKTNPMTLEAKSEMKSFLMTHKWEFDLYLKMYTDDHNMGRRASGDYFEQDSYMIINALTDIGSDHLVELATKEPHVKLPILLSTIVKSTAFISFCDIYEADRKNKGVQEKLAAVCSSLTLVDVKAIVAHTKETASSERVDFLVGIIECIRHDVDSRECKRLKCLDFIKKMENPKKGAVVSMSAFDKLPDLF